MKKLLFILILLITSLSYSQSWKYKTFTSDFDGKLLGTFISLIGIGVVAVPTGIVSASFVEILEEEKNRK